MQVKQLNITNKVLKRFQFVTFILISLLFLYLGIFLFIYGSAIIALIYIMLWLLSLLLIGAFYNKRGVISAFILYLISSQFIIGGILVGFDPSRYFFGYLVRTDYNIMYVSCSRNGVDFEGNQRIYPSTCPESLRGKKYSVITLDETINIKNNIDQKGYMFDIYLHNTHTNTRKQLSLQEAQSYSIIGFNSFDDKSPDGVYIESVPFGFPESEYFYYLTNSWGNQKKINGAVGRQNLIPIGWIKK
jgi:hypothetical protein